MSAANRSALFLKIHKVLRKHYEPVAPPSDRSVLEHLLYACVLEHARHDAADEVFAKLQKNYFDWNEVRVTSVAELSEMMTPIPDAPDAARRLKRVLQSVFETHYMFDIEFLRKQGLAKTLETIEKYSGVTPFVVAYVTQNALGGHAIPVNSESLALLMLLGGASEADLAKNRVPGLERTIPKNKGVEYASLLHLFAVDFAASPQSAKVKQVVGEIDPEARDRLPKKVVRPAPPPPAPVERKSPVIKPPVPPRPAAEAKSTKEEGPPKPEAPPKGEKGRKSEPAKPKPAAAESKSKTATARITRKKPK